MKSKSLIPMVMLCYVAIVTLGCASAPEANYRPNQFKNYVPDHYRDFPDFDCSYMGSYSEMRFGIVQKGGIADRAGVKSNDKILEVNNMEIRNAVDYFEKFILLWQGSSEVIFKIGRQDKTFYIKMRPQINYVDPIYLKILELNICSDDSHPANTVIVVSAPDKQNRSKNIYYTAENTEELSPYFKGLASYLVQSMPNYFYAGTGVVFINQGIVDMLLKEKQKQLAYNIFMDTKLFSILQAQYILYAEVSDISQKTGIENHFVTIGYSLISIDDGKILASMSLRPTINKQ